MQELVGGEQQVTFWAGQRIPGPIKSHKIKDSKETKLKDMWSSFYGRQN
jgi:hypothetical protein